MNLSLTLIHNTPLIISITLLVAALIALALCARRLHAVRLSNRSLQSEHELLKRRFQHLRSLKKNHTVTFLNLHAAHTEKMDDVLRTARRKLLAGQTDDLHHMLKSEKPLYEQTHLFNEMFDQVIFDIYPDFIDEVNTLLLPDRKFTISTPGQLSTELRILAGLRLGVDDTATVARILRLSHNTIYTYRNKLRSRAIDRESFDNDMRSLDLR